MKAPLVGVTVSLDPGIRLREGADYLYLNRSYGRAVRAAGGVPVLLSPEVAPAEALALCDALVISGGDDLPARAGADGALPLPAAAGTRPELPERVAWDRALLDAALAGGTPLLAVCYGMQLLNLHLGGTLVEDLAAAGSREADPGGLDHGGAGRFTQHALVRRRSHPALARLAPAGPVSSCHRQGLDRVAPGLAVLACAPDGLVEAVAKGDALGVEWHPERDATGPALYGWLVERARARGRGIPWDAARRPPGGRPR